MCMAESPHVWSSLHFPNHMFTPKANKHTRHGTCNGKIFSSVNQTNTSLTGHTNQIFQIFEAISPRKVKVPHLGLLPTKRSPKNHREKTPLGCFGFVGFSTVSVGFLVFRWRPSYVVLPSGATGWRCGSCLREGLKPVGEGTREKRWGDFEVVATDTYFLEVSNPEDWGRWWSKFDDAYFFGWVGSTTN